jgi:hypothetical protein
MEALTNKTKEQLIKVKSDYVKKYIGDFDKPIGYKQEISNLTRLINSKG